MKLFGVVTLAAALLQYRGRISYKALQQQFELDDDGLEALRLELIQVEQTARDEDGQYLVWADNESHARPAHELQKLQPLSTSPSIPVSKPVNDLTNHPSGMLEETATVGKHAGTSSDAERRPMTVMFCDLADSTALSTKLDPEDLQDVIRGYQELVTSIIREYQGFVAKYMGDGILVYFGYPKSLERNAERAVRAGLATIEALAKLNSTLGREKDIDIAVRIGISTGMVVVGEIVGEGLAQERTVIGEAPNVAARLQSLADRNQIVLGSLSKDVAGDSFEYSDLGHHELKGIDGRTQVWAVERLQDSDDCRFSRSGSSTTSKQAVLFGRDWEEGLLRQSWQSITNERQGKVVTISGEAGLGKSSLVDRFHADVGVEFRATITCSPYHANSAFYPLIEYLKRSCDWQSDDQAHERLSKLEARLDALNLPRDDMVPLIASLLSLQAPLDRYRSEFGPAQRQKQDTLDAIAKLMLADAEARPLVVICEDLHWADPSTLEFIELLIEQVPTASILLILTFRPEFVPTWASRSYIAPIVLNRLGRSHLQALIESVANGPLPHEIVDHIVTKSDGVPLFVEELTKALISSNVLRDTGQRLELSSPLESLSIPETLQESLMARLDRSPQMKVVAQLASVLGREFEYEMISGLAIVSDNDLKHGLAQLVDAELLYQRGRSATAKYIFKHALIQDTAYASLLRRTRDRYHLIAAKYLEERQENGEARVPPELVARHFTEAREAKEALPYWRDAGEHALARFAMAEAVSHLKMALASLEELPADRSRDEFEWSIQMLLGPALLAVEGYAFPDLEKTYRRAAELCQSLDKPVDRLKVIRGLQVFNTAGGRLEQALLFADEFKARATELGDPTFDVAARYVIGQTNFFLANYATALQALDEGMAIYDPSKHDMPNWPGGSAGLNCHLYAAKIHLLQGRPQKSLSCCDIAMSFARRDANKFNLENTITWVALVCTMQRDRERARELSGEGIVLCERQSNGYYLPFNQVIRAWADLEDRDPAVCISEIRQATEAYEKTGALVYVPYFYVLAAEGLAMVGEFEEAQSLADSAIAMTGRTQQLCWEADTYRMKADLLKAEANVEAEPWYVRSIEAAQFRQEKHWELRATLGLAELWREAGKYDDARKLLASIVGSFSSSDHSNDLNHARELLAATVDHPQAGSLN